MGGSTLKRSVATLGVTAGHLVAAGPASADTLTATDGTHSSVQSHDAARTVTMLDYEGSPVVTYTLKNSSRR